MENEEGGQEDSVRQATKFGSRRKKTKSSPDESPGSKSRRERELDRATSWVSLRGLFVSSTSGASSCAAGSMGDSDARADEEKKRKKENKVDKESKSGGGGGGSTSGRLRCSVSICNSKGSSDVVVQQGGGLEELATPETTSKSGAGGGCYRKAAAAASCRNTTTGRGEHSVHAGRRNNKHKVPLKEINGNAPATAPSASTSSSLSSSTRSAAGYSRAAVVVSSSSSSSTASSSSTTTGGGGGSFRGLPLRRFSVCQECHSVVDPVSRISGDPSLRSSLCPCPDCGEVFVKPDTLELHQRTRHAVLELGPEDTSRNIVEIIFQSSWLKKQPATCRIERILKINNTRPTISRFEDYRDAVRSRARKAPQHHHQQTPGRKATSAAPAPAQYPRCAADGNELLRFHCATVACSVGAKGCSSLCGGLPRCGACGIIRDGFRPDGYGKIRTMATSGRAHDTAQQIGVVAAGGTGTGDGRRAMLVCRVIAGRVMRGGMQDAAEEYDSVAGPPGVYSTLDELFVFNPRAILPCFLVVYREA